MKSRGLALAVLLGAVIRAPFWIEALQTPLDGDTAVIGLMARHPLAGATMWGQPYGSPIEAWIASPFLAVLGTTPQTVRLVYFLLGLALIPVAAWLAGALHPHAVLPAAFLAACPPPYLLLLAALPPPLYPATLLLLGLLLSGTIRLGAGDVETTRPPKVGLVLWGLAGGLALWTHLMSAGIVVLCGLFLFRRLRGMAWLAWALPALLIASGPLWLGLGDGGAGRILRPSGREQTMSDHLLEVVPRLHEPLGGLLGTHVPVIADDADHIVKAPRPVAASLILIYTALVVAIARRRDAPAGVGLLLGCVAIAVAAFPFPLRSSPSSIRFLTPIYLPLVALVAWFLATRTTRRRTIVVVLALALLHLAGATRLLDAWRSGNRAAAPFRLPRFEGLRRTLADLGIRRAYAAYGPAYRLTFETGERLVVSQPWNERFRHEPLPFLDEVRFARGVAWILFPDLPSDLPPPRAFEDALGAIGGRWRKTEIEGAVVYHDFVPPFGPAVVPCPDAGAAGDRDLATSVPITESRTFTFTPRALSAVTLVAPAVGARLPRGLDVEVSADGTAFERVVRRRRREERLDLRWVNGHPQYVIDDDLVSAHLGGRSVAAIRLTPVESPEPAALGELLLHPAADPPVPPAPWDEWLDPTLSWNERARVLADQPHPSREDWYYRSLLTARRR